MVEPALLTCQPEQCGLAETVRVPVFDQMEAEQCAVQEVAGLGVGLQRVIAGHPGVPAEDEGGPVPECLALLPLGEPQLSTEARVQKVVWSVSHLKRHPGCVCG